MTGKYYLNLLSFTIQILSKVQQNIIWRLPESRLHALDTRRLYCLLGVERKSRWKKSLQDHCLHQLPLFWEHTPLFRPQASSPPLSILYRHRFCYWAHRSLLIYVFFSLIVLIVCTHTPQFISRWDLSYKLIIWIY